MRLVNGVAIYGGFVGTETLRTERDWRQHLTILSGDVGQDDINDDGNNIAETTDDIVGTNACHLIIADGLISDTVLDGFIITAGEATGQGFSDDIVAHGGGLLMFDSNLTLSNLTFSGNEAWDNGGGIYALNLLLGQCKLASPFAVYRLSPQFNAESDRYILGSSDRICALS